VLIGLLIALLIALDFDGRRTYYVLIGGALIRRLDI